MEETLNALTDLNILSLEDSILDFEIINMQLLNAGFAFNIIRVEKGSDFETLIRNNKYDIILTDFYLPGFNAFSALDLVKEICPDVPVICLSGAIGEETAINLMKGGAVDYILKDRMERLPFAVKHAIEEARSKAIRKQAEEALQENNTRLELAMETAKMAWWEMEISSGNIRFSNRKAEMLGYSPKIFKHYSDFMDIIHPEDHEKTMDAMRNHLYGKADKYEVEYRIKSKKGEYLWFLDVGTVVKRDENGSPINVTGLVIDITERKLAEVSIKANELKFRTVADYTFDWEYWQDENYKLIYNSPSCERITGYKTEDFLANPDLLLKIVHPDDFNKFKEHVEHVFLTSSLNEISEIDFRILTKNGLTVEIYHVCRPIFDENNKYLGRRISNRDVTERNVLERKRKESVIELERRKVAALNLLEDLKKEMEVRKKIENDLIESKETLEKVNKHQIEIREEERATISREIHDQLGQSMTALKMDLAWLQNNKFLTAEAERKMMKMNDLIASTIKDIQRISSDLRPGILDDLGLASAIEWYCEEFSNRTGLTISTDIDNVQTGEPNKNITIYRVLQESLTNIIRHAKAKEANIKLAQVKDQIELTVLDDGRGIKQNEITNIKSLGILGMMERVKQCHGTMSISPAPTHGTIVKILIPV
jgi:PAS domain S-box-containing protein